MYAEVAGRGVYRSLLVRVFHVAKGRSRVIDWFVGLMVDLVAAVHIGLRVCEFLRVGGASGVSCE